MFVTVAHIHRGIGEQQRRMSVSERDTERRIVYWVCSGFHGQSSLNSQRDHLLTIDGAVRRKEQFQ